MLARSKGDGASHDPDWSLGQQIRSAVASSAAPEASSISSGLSIIGKIVGHGALTVFGHVEGELHASTVVIAESAQMEGELVAEELTIGGRVKGTIHANRVKLSSTAVVEGEYLSSLSGNRGECAIRGSVATKQKHERYSVARSNEPLTISSQQP